MKIDYPDLSQVQNVITNQEVGQIRSKGGGEEIKKFRKIGHREWKGRGPRKTMNWQYTKYTKIKTKNKKRLKQKNTRIMRQGPHDFSSPYIATPTIRFKGHFCFAPPPKSEWEWTFINFMMKQNVNRGFLFENPFKQRYQQVQMSPLFLRFQFLVVGLPYSNECN